MGSSARGTSARVPKSFAGKLGEFVTGPNGHARPTLVSTTRARASLPLLARRSRRCVKYYVRWNRLIGAGGEPADAPSVRRFHLEVSSNDAARKDLSSYQRRVTITRSASRTSGRASCAPPPGSRRSGARRSPTNCPPRGTTRRSATAPGRALVERPRRRRRTVAPRRRAWRGRPSWPAP